MDKVFEKVRKDVISAQVEVMGVTGGVLYSFRNEGRTCKHECS